MVSTNVMWVGDQGALSSLKWLRGSDDVDAEFSEIVDTAQRHADDTTGSSLFLFLSVLVDRRVFKPLLLSVACMFFQQMSGINAVIFYTSHIFASAGFASNPNTPTMIVGAVLVVATLISTLVADVAGRRVLLMTSGVAMTASIAVLGAYFYIHQPHQVTLSHTLAQPV